MASRPECVTRLLPDGRQTLPYRIREGLPVIHSLTRDAYACIRYFASRKVELCPWRSAAISDRPGIPRIMWKRIEDFCRSDLGIVVLASVVGLVLHVATNGQYGFHRDELQTLDDARHLDWGFVAYPPITPLPGCCGYGHLSRFSYPRRSIPIRLVRLSLGRHRDLSSRPAAEVRRSALVGADRRGPGPRDGNALHDGLSRSGNRRRGALHTRVPFPAQRMALGRRRRFHSRLSAESGMADATSLHISGVLVPSTRPRPTARAI